MTRTYIHPAFPSPPAMRAAARLFTGLLAGLAAVHGSDGDAPRGYLGFRGADTNPLTEVHDAWGLTLGWNFNRYWGLELAGDNFEKSIDPGGLPELGEYAVWSFVPQLRLRYPIRNNRVVPYVIGGIGGAFTQFNDRKPAGFGQSIQTDSGALLGSVGAGIEYFLSDNISLGIELKYLASSDQRLQVNGEGYPLSASAPLMMVSLRMHYPEYQRAPMAETRDPAPTRFYFGLRAGGALPVHDEVFAGVHAEPEPPAWGDTLDQLFGFNVGFNLGRYFSAELTVEGFETVLNVEGTGAIGEYAVASVLPQARFRYPLLDGRLMPYGIAGLGLGYHEFNDRKSAGIDTQVDGQPFGVAATLGVGLEYFVASNLALNLEARYLFSRGQSLQLEGGPERAGNLDALLFTIGLRVYFP